MPLSTTLTVRAAHCITLVTFPTRHCQAGLLRWGSALFARVNLAMPNGGQPELQQWFGALSQRLEELSAVPAGAGHAEEFVALFQEKRRLEMSLRGNPEPRFRNPSVENSTNPHAGHDSDNVLANVNRELRKLEKRDWELWLIVTATGILAGTGLLAGRPCNTPPPATRSSAPCRLKPRDGCRRSAA